MEDVKINVKLKLSVLWIAAMFSWVYGDLLVLLTQEMWLVAAITMMIPVAMVFLSLELKYKANRRANIIVGIFYTGYNLIGLPTYPSAYDQFLIIVGLVFTALIVWYAYKWK